MWVKFDRDFDYRPTKMSVVAYKKGMHLRVKKECGEQAVAGGYAHEEANPRDGETSETVSVPRVEG